MLMAAVVIVWAAAVYRIAISSSQQRTLWRTSFTAAMILDAVALTIYRLRVNIDEVFAAPNLAGLLARLAITFGVGCVVIYLHTLRIERVPTSVIVIYAALTTAVAATLVGSWVAAPFHAYERDDLLTATPSAAAGVYFLTFWSSLAVGLIMTAVTCLRRRRSLRHRDKVWEISLLCSASGSMVGVLVMGLWSLSFVLEVAGVDSGLVNHAGDLLMPLSAGLIGIGVVSLLVLPYFADLYAARRLCRQLRPLWLDTIAHYPELHLDTKAAGGGPLSRAQFTLERMIIEILDVLRLAPAAPPREETSAYDAVIRAVCGRDAYGQLRASELLEPAETRGAELEQLLELAGAHERLRHARA